MGLGLCILAMCFSDDSLIVFLWYVYVVQTELVHEMGQVDNLMSIEDFFIMTTDSWEMLDEIPNLSRSDDGMEKLYVQFLMQTTMVVTALCQLRAANVNRCDPSRLNLMDHYSDRFFTMFNNENPFQLLLTLYTCLSINKI